MYYFFHFKNIINNKIYKKYFIKIFNLLKIIFHYND